MNTPMDTELLDADSPGPAAQRRRSLEAFRRFMPDVAAQFEHYVSKQGFKFFMDGDGYNLRLADGRCFYSAGGPRAECRRQMLMQMQKWPLRLVRLMQSKDTIGQIHLRYINEICADLSRLKTEAVSVAEAGCVPHAVMLGCGLGYQLEALYAQCEVLNLVIIEPDADLFWASLSCTDWERVLTQIQEQRLGLHLMIGQKPAQVIPDMLRFYHEHGYFLTTALQIFLQYRTPDLDELARVFAQDYFRQYSALGFFDDALFGLSQALSTAAAGRRFCRRDAKLPSALTALPVFLVANGPSLDHDIPFLRRNQDRAVIIACGTALETLYNAGIQADLCCLTERVPQIINSVRYITDRHYLERVVLLAPDVLHPSLVRLFRHSLSFAKQDELFILYALTHIGNGGVKPIGLMNPLAANTGLAAAEALGFRQLYLFGFDNGRRSEAAQMHSRYNRFYDLNRRGIKDHAHLESAGMTVPGNFGGTVLSDRLFQLSNRNLSVLLEPEGAGKDVTCHNCSDGAAIEYALPLKSADLDTSAWPDLDKDALRREVLALGFVPELKDDSGKLFDRAEYERITGRLSEIVAEGMDSRAAVVRRLELSCEFLQALCQHPDYALRVATLRGSVNTFFIAVMFALFHCHDEAVCLKAVERIIYLYRCFLSDCGRVYALMPHYVIRKHRTLMHGRCGFPHPGVKNVKMPRIKLTGRRVRRALGLKKSFEKLH